MEEEGGGRVVALRGADEKFITAVVLTPPETMAAAKSVAVSWEKAVEEAAARVASIPPVGTPALGRAGEVKPGGGMGGISSVTVEAFETWVRTVKMLVAVKAVEAAEEAVMGVLDMALSTALSTDTAAVVSVTEAEEVVEVEVEAVDELELETKALPITCTAASYPPGCDRAPLERAEDTPAVSIPREGVPPAPVPPPPVESRVMMSVKGTGTGVGVRVGRGEVVGGGLGVRVDVEDWVGRRGVEEVEVVGLGEVLG